MVMRAKTVRLLPRRSRAAIDGTGLETQYVSRYYRWRSGRPEWCREWPKLTVVCDLASHFWLAGHVCMGPCMDSPQLKPAVSQAVAHQAIDELLGDKGYDAEHNHRLCREELGIPSTLIGVRKRSSLSRTQRWPDTPYRREMKRRIPRSDFGQRWQVESAISRNKRRLGTALRARRWPMQQWECYLRVLTHNLMLLAGT